MKKFLILFSLIITLNFSCKEYDKACGCYNPVPLTFNLVVKNTTGGDLLNPALSGYYAKDEIKLYREESNGSHTSLAFQVTPPIPSGSTKLDYYKITSSALISLVQAKMATSVFLQFKDEEPYRVDVSYEQRNNRLILSLAGFDIPKDENMLPYLNALFYFTKSKR